MANKQVALDIAAFLDSAAARGLGSCDREGVRRVATIFLTICYEELGKAPNLLDGQDVHAVLGHSMPGHMKRADPVVEHVPAILYALIEHLGESYVLRDAFELRNAIEAAGAEFLAAVRSGREMPRPQLASQDPLVHRAPKMGRNEPCFCGSGKKFKKCHGKAE